MLSPYINALASQHDIAVLYYVVYSTVYLNYDKNNINNLQYTKTTQHNVMPIGFLFLFISVSLSMPILNNRGATSVHAETPIVTHYHEMLKGYFCCVLCWLLEFYDIASKVISGRALTCDSAHSWRPFIPYWKTMLPAP